jgi:hypothetical protein
MRIVEDSKKGLFAIGEPVHSDPGERSNFGARIVMINKYTGEMLSTLLSTAGERNELIGNCAAD